MPKKKIIGYFRTWGHVTLPGRKFVNTKGDSVFSEIVSWKIKQTISVGTSESKQNSINT